MAVSPERRAPVEVEKLPEVPEVSPELEKAGVQPAKTQFPARVKDDKGKHLIQTPATKTVTIQLPTDQATLRSRAKGSVTNSVTWLANFWLRMIKKATHFDWGIIPISKRKAQNSNPQVKS